MLCIVTRIRNQSKKIVGLNKYLNNNLEISKAFPEITPVLPPPPTF